MTRCYGSPDSLHILTSCLNSVRTVCSGAPKTSRDFVGGVSYGDVVCLSVTAPVGVHVQVHCTRPWKTEDNFADLGLAMHLDTGITSMHQYSQLCFNVTVLFIL